jgi:CRP/FNR family transcriptional regulator
MAMHTVLPPPDNRPELSSGMSRSFQRFESLRQHAQILRLRRRQRLQIAADDSNLFIVRAGILIVQANVGEGKRSLLDVYYPGDVLLTDHIPELAEYAITSASLTEVWRVKRSAFVADSTRDAALLGQLLHRLSSQRARSQMHAAIIAGLTSEERVAALLIEAGCRLGSPSAHGVTLEMPLSRTEIAEYLALNADTLSRLMSRLAAEGLIDRAGRARITIRDWAKLEERCPLAAAIVAMHRNCD